jgi:hypothetical protein
MKLSQNQKVISGLGTLLVIIALILMMTPNPQTNQPGASAETIAVNPATVDFYTGTTATGDVAGDSLSYAVAVNSTYVIVNATVVIQNSTDWVYNASQNATVFNLVTRVSGLQKYGTLYMNFTAYNSTTSIRSSTNTYIMDPSYGTATKADYGDYCVISGGLINDTFATQQLYYGAYYFKSLVYNVSGGVVTTIWSKRQ